MQGSVAMATVVQSEGDDYDIDIAVVVDKSVLGEKSPQTTRNMFADVLRRKMECFNVEPEAKTRCVRIRYAEGYHVDFAVYRRECDCVRECWNYEHAGTMWGVRVLEEYVEWTYSDCTLL